MNNPPKIKKLSKELINLIAAGEVVERPASVLKELLENSIDAGSSVIKVNIEEAGTKLIEVIDDGIGMDLENAKLALEQHATSKIGDINDLESISTMGFRGEALASISSVSEKAVISTKTENGKSIEIEYSNNSINETRPSRSDRGTRISVKNLFANIPARKKFLKSNNTELRHIIDTFNNTALPFVGIHFELYHNRKLVQKLSASNDYTNRVYELFGKETSKNIFQNHADADGFKLTGLFGNSFIAKNNNKKQYIYINNRYIKSGLINTAIKKAYHGYLHKDLNPTYMLFIELNPREVDVNVHPRKLEVKFTDEQRIFSVISRFTKSSLEKSQTLNREESDQVKTPESSDRSLNELKPTIKAPLTKKYDSYTAPKSFKVNDAIRFTESIYNSKTSNNFVGNSELRSENREQYSYFQIFNTYICYEKENKIIFIDQHAAAEKIQFDKLIQNIGRVTTKPLLVPEMYEFRNNNDKDLVLSQKDELDKIGFIVEDFGGNTIQITEIPELSETHELTNIIDDFLKNDSELGIKENSDLLEQYGITKSTYLKIATIACHGSIRAGQKLNTSEMSQIVNDVNALKPPLNCPHGRPIQWELSKSKIENNFNRDI